MEQTKQAHAQLITTGLILHPVPANKLLERVALSSFGSLSYAQKVFDQIPCPDLFLHNTMIKAHSLPSTSHNSFAVFRAVMRAFGLLPNQYTFVFLMKACGNGLGVLEGEQVRVHAISVGLDSNVFVMNATIGMYVNLGMVEEARKVFDWSVNRDMYSWNILVNGYVGMGDMDQAMEWFDKMPEHDVVSWSTIIAGYVQVTICFV